jgi:hypothetical protein
MLCVLKRLKLYGKSIFESANYLKNKGVMFKTKSETRYDKVPPHIKRYRRWRKAALRVQAIIIIIIAVLYFVTRKKKYISSSQFPRCTV